MDARLLESKGNVVACLDRLSSGEQEAIDIEIERAMGRTHESRRYFLENYFVINTKGEDWQAQRLQTVYPFTETQEILWTEFVDVWSKGLPAWFLLLKARQIRWSTLVQGCIFCVTISEKLTNSLVIGDELKRSNQIYAMSDLAYSRLPWWMRPERSLDNRGEGVTKFSRKDKDERLRNPGLESTFFIDAANKPSGSSRGFTLHNVHATEFGLWSHPEILTSDIIPAVPKRNPNVICVVEGTAKGSGENYAFLRMWKMASEGRGLFRAIFAGWWKEKTYSKPFPSNIDEGRFEFTREEQELVAKVEDEFQYRITMSQMNWYREQAEQFEATEGDAQKMEQEYPSFPQSAFRSGGLHAFPARKLAQIEVRDVRKPKWFGELEFKKEKDITGKDKDIPILVTYPDKMLHLAPMWVWEWPTSKELYYMASDPAKGIPGEDYSTIQIFRVPRKKGERIRQCLEIKGYYDGKALAKMCVELGKIYNTCEMAPECNSQTEHIHNIIFIHNYTKVYRWRRQDKVKNRFGWFFGWETNMKSRDDLIIRFRSLMIEDSIEIRSSRLHSECQTFVKGDDVSRYEAAAGEHDDVLFSAMICVYCLMELDPRLFEMVDDSPPPDPNLGKHNTDHSLFDEQDEAMQSQFNML